MSMQADDDQDECCPLCMEELDLTDKTFNACPCGYQICLWCWHQIKNEYNGKCPACRAPYAELTKQKAPLDREDVIRRTKQRKQKEKSERRSSSSSSRAAPPVNRKNLANVRVMQRNLVYVIGLPPMFADEDILRSNEGLGQYGKIIKAVVNKSHLNSDRANATASAYITFANKDDAMACILAIDGFLLDGSMLRASFGTTKYCNFFLRNMQCNNPDCLYLHELGDQEDSFTKEEMQTALHTGKAAFRDLPHSGQDIRSGQRFPSIYRGAENDDNDQTSPHTSASGDAQRKAQSAAAVHKLRQSSATSKPASRVVKREDSYSRIVSGSADTSSVSSRGSITSPGSKSSDHEDSNRSPSPDHRKPSLHVDTSPVDAVVGPLEALKLAASSASQEPAWAQPFPSPAIVHQEHQEQEDTPSVIDSLFTPFSIGFDGGLRSNTRTESSWGDTSAGTSNSMQSLGETSSSTQGLQSSFQHQIPFSSPSTEVPSSSSQSPFASIDAIFSQRNESSEALAGLLGVHLSETPLVHGAQQQGSHTSRFAFANTPGGSRLPTPSPMAPPTESRVFGYDGFGAVAVQPPLPSSTMPPLSGADGFGLFGPAPGFSRMSGMGSDLFANGTDYPTSNKDSAVSGLAFLQQMLPNVNISFGGEYSAPRSEMSGAGEAWGSSGHLGSLQMSASTSSQSASSLPFHDPAIVAAPGLGGFYGFGGAEQEDERRLQVPFN